MLRIMHLSDLHFEDIHIQSEKPSLIKRLENIFNKEIIPAEIEDRGHDQDKLDALKNILPHIHPDIIIVTGDITNLGDLQSFEFAKKELDDFKARAKAKAVYCVPGNHDILFERIQQIRGTLKGKILTAFLEKISAIIAKIMHMPSKQPDCSESVSLLQNYCKFSEGKYDEPNPGDPKFQDAEWGEVALFLFNSTNDPGYMANEGSIGRQQFNALNKYIQDPANKEKLNRAVRIALLHHHPISAPEAMPSAIERAYNWMKDGPRFLSYMNDNQFHFILHGHEHVPFQCTIDYHTRLGHGIHIIAAGSALKSNNSIPASFNVIDLLTPFEARLRRYEYRDTGYLSNPQLDLRLPIRPVEEIRLSKEETTADLAMRKLFMGRDEAIDEEYHYKLLEYNVIIESNQLYKASYRRQGIVESIAPVSGPIFIITGSPGNKFEDMQAKAVDGDNKDLAIKRLSDCPNQKIMQILHKLQLTKNDAFDLTLNFQWQASRDEPNDFDGMNLMYFRHGVDRLKYRVKLPWKPAQPKVLAWGIKAFSPQLENEGIVEESQGTYIYSFEIKKPQPLAYLIYFARESDL